MDTFSYVMTLVAIIVGLGITHILSGLGHAIQRLSGHGAPIRLESVYLYWVSNIFIWLISFWWFEYKFYDLQTEWTFGLYTFIVLYAVFLYMVAVVLVPVTMSEMHDSYEYFMNKRKWIFSFFILLFIIDTIDTFLKGWDWGIRPIYIMQTTALFITYLVGLIANGRRVQLTNAIVAFIIQFGFMFLELTRLGNF